MTNSKPSYIQELVFETGGFYAGILLFFAFAGGACAYSGVTGWGTETGATSTGTTIFGVVLGALSILGIAYILWTTARVATVRR